MAVGTCLYCSRRLEPEDEVAMCDVCCVGHHRDCWARNGRCSTFRCTGSPRYMTGEEYAAALEQALETANSEPRNCPLCGGQVYAGTVQGRKEQGTQNPVESSLIFRIRRRTGESSGSPARRLVERVFGARQWRLPGVVLRARSCGNCRALFLWGTAMDDNFIQIARAQAAGRYCVHCGTAMWEGDILVHGGAGSHARFHCDTVPLFHRDWLLHNTLDRFVYNRWPLRIPSIPACSCPNCRYTEVCGRPIYRFG